METDSRQDRRGGEEADKPRHPTPRHWPNLAPPEPIPANAADHAEQFALTWYDHLESLIKKRLRELGIPDSQIGAFDHDFDLRLAAFHPKERTGGGISPGARINLNSGVFNPELLVPHPSPTVSSIWGRLFLRFRGLQIGIRRNCFHSKHL